MVPVGCLKAIQPRTKLHLSDEDLKTLAPKFLEELTEAREWNRSFDEAELDDTEFEGPEA
jgi:hypothetical protein